MEELKNKNYTQQCIASINAGSNNSANKSGIFNLEHSVRAERKKNTTTRKLQ